jgi:16S rRNA (cytidine1402-2'-O)-methyltransferase
VCRELTKGHEEVRRGTIASARSWFAEHEPRGEVTLVIGGAAEEKRWDEAAVRRALAAHRAEGLSASEAARQVAQLSGWPRGRVYQLSLERDHEPG